jgi:hypothetical protein
MIGVAFAHSSGVGGSVAVPPAVAPADAPELEPPALALGVPVPPPVHAAQLTTTAQYGH